MVLYNKMSVNVIQSSSYLIKQETVIKENKKKLNLPVLLSSAAGVLIPLAIARKKQGLNIKYADIKNLKFKEKFSKIWKSFNIDYGLKEILSVGAGSTLFGLGAGIIVDKDRENRKEKIKEGIFSIDNIIIPTIFTASMLKLLKNSKNKTLSKIVSPLVGIGLGMPIASKISNIIISKFDKNNKERKLKFTDAFVHIDDFVDVLVLAKSKIAQKIQAGRILGLIYFINAYKVGSKVKED